MKKAMGVEEDHDDSEVEEIVELLEPVSVAVAARACLLFSFSFFPREEFRGASGARVRRCTCVLVFPPFFLFSCLLLRR
jgi:hypothetical protein